MRMTHNEKRHYITQETKVQFETELKELKSSKVPSIADRIDEARQMGDLSENAEYQSAREEMAWAKTRVQELEAILKDAEIITKGTSGDTVDLGSKIQVEVNGKEREYTIVGAQEANPLEKLISNESPLGSAFIGKKVGDSIEVEIPAGTQTYTIKKIS